MEASREAGEYCKSVKSEIPLGLKNFGGVLGLCPLRIFKSVLPWRSQAKPRGVSHDEENDPKGAPKMARIPDPNALRRDRKDDMAWTVLDPSGKVEPTPDWPLVEPSDRELELWGSIWKRPQSLLWQQYLREFEVALYIRRLSEVELRNAIASLHTLLIRQMESLLLTTPSMYKAKVRIGKVVSKQKIKKETRRNSQCLMRDRLKVVLTTTGA